ncbi:integrase [Sphingomonas zeicaulis]|uniref:tyrosine-type recombinase/integrase n=1 Tax=Sphingomonas zeicaulis TaxID=1632740 RepID=UPI003D25D68C
MQSLKNNTFKDNVLDQNPLMEGERSSTAFDGHLLALFQPESNANHPLVEAASERLNGNVARRRFTTTGFVWDDEVKGFGLRHTAAGAKRWIVQYRHRGKTRREILGDAKEMSPKLARLAAKRVLAAAALDGLPQPVVPSAAKPLVTFAQFAEEFWTDYAPHWKPSTRRSNRSRIKRRLKPVFGDKPVAQITRADVVSWRDSMVERSGDFNRSIPVLSVMLGYAEKLGYRPEGSNPCKGMARYKRPLKERCLSRREFRRLAAVLAQHECSSPEFTAFVRLLIYTGARRGEIAGLRWEWIGADYIDLPDSKTGPKRLYLNAQANAVLDRVGRQASGAAFQGVLNQKVIDLQWHEIRHAAAIPDVRLHDLRHTFASVAITHGISLAKVGKLLGHVLPETTARYAHLADEAIVDAAERVSASIAQALGMRS